MFWVDGWVEVTQSEGPEQLQEHAWSGAIWIGSLLSGADHVSERIFGLSKRCFEAPWCQPLLPERGVPANASQRVRAELGIEEHERDWGPDYDAGQGTGHYTHSTWRELKDLLPQVPEVSTSDWHVVFALLEQLEASGRYSADQIRVVVWCVWS